MSFQKLVNPHTIFDELTDHSGNATVPKTLIPERFFEKPTKVNDVKEIDLQIQKRFENIPIVFISSGITDDPLWKLLENPARSNNKEIIRKRVEDLQEEFWSRIL